MLDSISLVNGTQKNMTQNSDVGEDNGMLLK